MAHVMCTHTAHTHKHTHTYTHLQCRLLKHIQCAAASGLGPSLYTWHILQQQVMPCQISTAKTKSSKSANMAKHDMDANTARSGRTKALWYYQYRMANLLERGSSAPFRHDTWVRRMPASTATHRSDTRPSWSTVVFTGSSWKLIWAYAAGEKMTKNGWRLGTLRAHCHN